MHRVIATIHDGRVELNDAVDWPDGTKVEVTLLSVPDYAKQASPSMAHWPDRFFTRLQEKWGDEPFERPPQGQFEDREKW